MPSEAYLDLLAATLTEHDKSLDRLIGKLEKIITVKEPETDLAGDFVDVVGEALVKMKLPKGYTFKIGKIRHTAHVAIVYDEPTNKEEA